MSPFLFLRSLQEYKQSLQFQGLLLALRLLLAIVLAWQVYTVPDFSSIYTDQSIYIALIVYASFALANGLLVLFRPTRPIFFYLGLALDYLFALLLPFLLANQADIAIIMAVIFIIAALHDLRITMLGSLAAGYMLTALAAGWYFNTLVGSQLATAHLTAASLFLVGLLVCFRSAFLVANPEASLSLSPAMQQKQHLVEGLSYLYPFHQRNRMPLSLLMIRIEVPSRQRKTFMQQLFTAYKDRLRKCDLLVQINSRHLAILLCDTSASQSSHLVKALAEIKGRMDFPDTWLTYGVCSIPLEQECSLEPILTQMMDSLTEASQQKVQRLVFITARQND